MTGFFEITAPTESLSAGHGRHQSNHHPRTEVKDSDQVGSYLFYVNGKFLLFHTGPSQPIWVVSSYNSIITGYKGITCSLTPLDMGSYFFYANLKYLALLGTRT